MVTIKQQSHKAAHLPGSGAAPGAILQMFDPQVPPGHGDLLVGICSSADDILKGVLLPRDLCALQGNSEALRLQGCLSPSGSQGVAGLPAQHRNPGLITPPHKSQLRLPSHPKLGLDAGRAFLLSIQHAQWLGINL